VIVILTVTMLTRESVGLCRGVDAQSVSAFADVRTSYHIHLYTSYNYYLSMNQAEALAKDSNAFVLTVALAKRYI
jgi:hypothetical protein